MFAGLKVVELASVLAGAAVGQFFAELGAEVIKIENLDGTVDTLAAEFHWNSRPLALPIHLTDFTS